MHVGMLSYTASIAIQATAITKHFNERENNELALQKVKDRYIETKSP